MKHGEARIGNQSRGVKQGRLLGFVLLLCFLLLFLLLSLPSYRPSSQAGTYFASVNGDHHESTQTTAPADPCLGRYIYVQEPPSRFTDDLLRDCKSATLRKDRVSMCHYVANYGLGPKIIQGNPSSATTSWYSTHQYTLEVIFHHRIKTYDCLTNKSSMASAIYVPFYGALDFRKHMRGFDVSVRDALGMDLVRWLKGKPEWKQMSGHDHFLMVGRSSYDCSRRSAKREEWGTNFLNLPEVLNLTALIIESSRASENQVSVPYSTYFHPYEASEVRQWQDSVRASKRSVLFSFSGADRRGFPHAPRALALRQCVASDKCEFFNCGDYNLTRGCADPILLMKLFKRSVFCLQPTGDTYTRRSTIDTILGGCIPVFFDPRTAYEQYPWYLPKDHEKFSVYIPREELKGKKPVSIEEVLVRIPEKRVREMREEVIRLIPKIIYAHPERTEKFEDAFDIAMKGVLERVSKWRREERR